MEGKIIKVIPSNPHQTVIYERNGMRYRGYQAPDGTYYFGPDGYKRNSDDIDEAWARAYTPRQPLHAGEEGK